MNRREEGQRLLATNSVLLDEDSDDDVLFTSNSESPEGPPPAYIAPQAATLVPTPSVEHVSAAAGPGPINEAPPDYYLHEPKKVGKAGMAVHIQIDGKLVPGTVMDDGSGQHMVYICQPRSDDSAVTPAAPSTAAGGKPPCPKDFIILSLLSILCCCAPLGIVALIKSLEVQRLYRRGDYSGAVRASRQAHSWGSAGVVCGTTLVVIAFAIKMYFQEIGHGRHYYYNY